MVEAWRRGNEGMGFGGRAEDEYVSRRGYFVKKSGICVYALSGYDTKPGGTAGVLLLSLQDVVVGDEGIFLCFFPGLPPDA